MLKAWWESWPERLDFELKALEDAGIRVEGQSRVGYRLELRLKHVLLGEDTELVARFPELYPYTRFELYAPNLDLPRHQHPFEKNLCLLAGGTENWRTSDTLASFILGQLPRVIEAATSEDPERVADLEERQGEPFSSYYYYQPGTTLLVDGAWDIPSSVQRGRLQLALLDADEFRGIVLEVTDAAENALAQCGPALDRLAHSSNAATIPGRWVRLDQPIRAGDATSFSNALFALHPNLRDPRWRSTGKTEVDVIGVLFPEEVAWRRKGLGWVFLVRVRRARRGFREQSCVTNTLVRAGYAGNEDLLCRIPELRPLGSKSIAAFGLGCVGAPSILEFARAGVGDLRILDYDFVEPGTTVRWPLGLSQAGRFKAASLAKFLAVDYPYTRVSMFVHRIGSVPQGGPGDIDVLEQIMAGVSLIYDATAEIGIQLLLSDLARDLRLPYIGISTTAGAWGGRVVRVRPEKTAGCWGCLQYHMTDGTIPVPPAAEDGWVEPQSCNSPTFTGAEFDIMQVPIMGVRTAVSTLCEVSERAYPTIDWDVAVLSLRARNGQPIAPKWDVFPLERHGSCKRH